MTLKSKPPIKMKGLELMKKKNTESYKKICRNKFNNVQNAKGYPIKRVAFHRKVGKNK